MTRTRYTAAERKVWVRRFERGEKSAAAFCRDHGLVHGTFARWVREHRRMVDGDTTPTGAPIEFVRLTRSGEERSSEIAVMVGRSRVVVRRGFDAKLLRDVVAALADGEAGS